MTRMLKCKCCGVDPCAALVPTNQTEESLIVRLRKRAEIRRQITTRKSVQEGKPDRIADLLEEAAAEIEVLKERELAAVLGGSDKVYTWTTHQPGRCKHGFQPGECGHCERERLRTALKETERERDMERMEKEAARNGIAVLQAALKEYGMHKDECTIYIDHGFDGPWPCNCGLSSLLGGTK